MGKLSTESREHYQHAVALLGCRAFWREWWREQDRKALMRQLQCANIRRQAGRAALEEQSDG